MTHRNDATPAPARHLAPRRIRRALSALGTAGAVAVGGVGILAPATAQAAGVQDNRLSVLAGEPGVSTTSNVDLTRTEASGFTGMKLRLRPDGTVTDA